MPIELNANIMENRAKHVKDEQIYPGADVDAADRDEVNVCLQKQAVRQLNNNPRNDDD